MCCRFSHRMWTVYFHLHFCWWIFVLKCSDSGQSVSWWVSPFECCTESADGDFYSKLNNQLTMLARSLAEGKLFSCHSERRHCKRQNLCEENENTGGSASGLTLSQWCFHWWGKNNKHSWPFFHIIPVSIHFASRAVFVSFSFSCQGHETKVNLWKILLWTRAPLLKELKSICFISSSSKLKWAYSPDPSV